MLVGGEHDAGERRILTEANKESFNPTHFANFTHCAPRSLMDPTQPKQNEIRPTAQAARPNLRISAYKKYGGPDAPRCPTIEKIMIFVRIWGAGVRFTLRKWRAPGSPGILIGPRQDPRPHPGLRLRRDASSAESTPAGQTPWTTIYERMHGMATGLPK